jgi:integrase
MAVHLTERVVKAAVHDPARKTFLFDDECLGFALSLSTAGAKRFVLDYTIARRQRRVTIGAWPAWSVVAAREEARHLKREIDRGVDPLERRDEARDAATFGDLATLYREQHLPRLAPRNASDQESMLDKLILPEWRKRKVAEITPADVEKLLRAIAAGRARPAKAEPKNKRRAPLAPPRPTPVRANRCGEVLRKMFRLAVDAKMRPDNPAQGFFRRLENARETFLDRAEILRLAEVLAAQEDQGVAALLRMCMLTGARLGEVRCARFEQFNLSLGIWTKQAAQTKQRRVHRLPVSADMVALVRERREVVPADCPWLFPGEIDGQPVQDFRRFWRRVKSDAELPSNLRVHDLRHTFASLLASGGASLSMIGKLLGHTQSSTTERYSHLVDSALRNRVDEVGGLIRPALRVVDPAGAAAA